MELTHESQFFYSPGLTGTSLANVTAEEEGSKAILLLKNADDNRYQSLSVKLKESTFLDRDEYPITISDMYELMVKTASTYTNINKGGSNKKHGMMLVQ